MLGRDRGKEASIVTKNVSRRSSPVPVFRTKQSRLCGIRNRRKHCRGSSKHVKNSILSVDSSQQWLDQVSGACASSQTKPELTLSISVRPATGVFQPMPPPSRAGRTITPLFGRYHAAPRRIYISSMADSEWRASPQIVLHCRPNAIIGIHDFSSRPNYHCVREIAQEIATAGDMSFFLPLPKKTLQRPFSGRFALSRPNVQQLTFVSLFNALVCEC